MKKLKVGIIGCGTIAEGQAIAAKQLKNTELTAVCDVIEENAWLACEVECAKCILQIIKKCCRQI